MIILAVIQLNANTKDLYQFIEANIKIKNEDRVVRFELRYLPATEKWYLSMFDVQSGESYFRYVPVVACDKDTNNLIAPFYYKDIGVIVCWSKVDNLSSESPQENNLGEFYLVRGDEIVQ